MYLLMHVLMLLERFFHFRYQVHWLLELRIEKFTGSYHLPSSRTRIFGFRINARAIAE
jgi:hypothetical protein